MWKRPTCQTLSRAWDISSATVQVAPDLLKMLAILSETEDLAADPPKTILEIRKKGHISLGDQQAYYLQVFQRKNRRKTNSVVVFSYRPFPKILKYRDHQWDLPTTWKIRLFQTLIEDLSWYVWKFRLTIL